MTTTRAPKLCSRAIAVAALLAAACASSKAVVTLPSAMTSTGASAEPPPRRPDGVVVEPPAAMPSVATRAEARGVVALRQSLSGDAVRDVALELVAAWEHGSLDGLAALLAADAGPIDARARGPGALVESFRQRLRAHEYKKLEGMDLVRPDRIEHYAWGELGGPDAPARPADMRPDELFVRVPLEVTQAAGEKFFDGVIVLLLRGEEGRAKIVGYGETP